MAKKPKPAKSITDLLRVPAGPVRLEAYDPRATPGFEGDKRDAKEALPALAARFADLQERLYANGRTGDRRRVLLVLQGMDTSGKGGTIKHVIGSMNPQGAHIASFKKPTEEERRQHFLWRIRRQIPAPGLIGVFDRSHCEDVLVARVHELASREEIEARYDAINRFEAELVDSGVALLKVMLHISYEEQRKRLLARLDDPTKRWKLNPADIEDRALWPRYQEAYELALTRCVQAAGWHVVPADRKWYRNWAVGRMLIETLDEMNPRYPEPDLDIAELRRQLEAQ